MIFSHFKQPYICYTKLVFVKGWGGAFFISLLFLASTSAQFLCLPQLVEFEIVKVPPQAPWRAKHTSLNNPGAFQAFYHVNLKAKSGNLPTQMAISQLSFNGVINANNFTSSINRALTEQLLPVPNSPGLTDMGQFLNLDDLANGEVNWEIIAGTSCQNQEPPVQILLPPNTSSIRLFTIVADAVPGDFLKWNSFSGWYDDCMNCMGNVFVSAVGGNTNILFPQPAASNAPLQLTFEFVPPSIQNYPIVRVKAQSLTASVFGKMDGVVHIVPDMTPASLDFLVKDLTILGGPTLIDKIVRENSDGSFDIYFSFTDWENTADPVSLFDLEMPGFFNQSQGGILDCSLTTGRWTLFPFDSNPVTYRLNSVPKLINIPGRPICAPEIKISSEVYKNPQDCSTGVRFVFEHGNPQPISLNFLKFEFVLIPTSNTNETPGAVTSTVPHAATNGELITGSNAYAYRYVYAGQIDLENGAYVDIPFEITRGCIKYFVSLGEGIITGGSLCAFEVMLGEDICDPKIFGEVFYDNGKKVQDYRLRVESINNSNYELESLHNCEDNFSLCADAAQAPFRLRVLPQLNAPYLEGVTTYDCVLISKHILGLEPFNTPYKHIAANANEQGDPDNNYVQAISTTDVNNIRKCILGIQNNFGSMSAPPYRYVSDLLQLPANPVQGTNPPYMTANVVDVPSNGMPFNYGNFKAIKMGDVNRSANEICGMRPAGQLKGYFKISEIDYTTKGGSVFVALALNAPHEVIAAQLGLRFDAGALQLKAIHPNPAFPIGQIHFGRSNEASGELRFAWDSPDAFTTLDKDTWLFKLEFEIRPGQTLPDKNYLVWSADQMVPGFIYDLEGNEYASKLQLLLDRTSNGGKLGPIVAPNPFQDRILAYVYAESPAKARLSIQDARGQLVVEQDIELREGDNTLEVSVDPSTPAGLYFLVLESELGRVVRRLTKI